jgi:ketosteroid isomerase-like protein
VSDPGGGDAAAANAALALRFVQAAQVGDAEVVAACLVEDYVQTFPRPGIPGLPAGIEGRDQVVEFLAMLPAIYEPGSIHMEVEHVVAEGPMVVIQFRMTARTAAGDDYENHYVQILECRGGKVARSWEYCDTLYAAQKLMPDALA